MSDINNRLKKAGMVVLFILAAGCSGDAVMSDLVNPHTRVILKGTYESNTPHSAGTLHVDDILAGGGYPDISTPILASELLFNFDIAEIRMAQGEGQVDYSQEARTYWELFSRNRIVLCQSSAGSDGSSLINCANSGGVSRRIAFFKEGYEFEALDLIPGTYNHFGVYVRKLIAAPAQLYSQITAPVAFTTKQAIFDNEYVYGYDLADELLQFSKSDSNQTSPLLFPLERTDLSIEIPSGNDPLVIEVRVFILNQLMKHVIDYGDGTALTFVGPSDSVVNHSVTGSLKTHLGGNLRFFVRSYNSEKVGSILINDPDPVPVGHLAYYIAVPEAESATHAIDEIPYKFPYAVTSVADGGGTSTGTINNLPGETNGPFETSYLIYKACDKKKMQTGDATNTPTLLGQDGFPESIIQCNTGGGVSVTTGNTTTVNLGVACTCP